MNIKRHIQKTDMKKTNTTLRVRVDTKERGKSSTQ